MFCERIFLQSLEDILQRQNFVLGRTLAWIDDVLDIRETANYDLEGIDYDIRIFDSPNEMRELVW